MKRLATSIAAAAIALGIGACEKQSAENLPEHYKHKGNHKTAGGGEHGNAPAPAEKEKAPKPEHKG